MNILGHDRFRLISYHHLHTDERNVLTLLYQPILGSDAFTLYLTLWSLLHKTTKKSPEYAHNLLFDTLRFSPSTFEQARQKLEAIGLLDTYHNDEMYLYELNAPLEAEAFIKDGSLGAYLFSRIGKDVFDTISGLFQVSADDKEGFKNISSTFDKVFDSLPKPIDTHVNYQTKSKGKPTIQHNFDFDVFLEGLSKNFVDRRKITKTLTDKIMNLSYVYSLDEFTMQKVYMDTVDKNRNIDVNLLSKNARKWFEFEKDTRTVNVEPQNDKEQISYEDIIDQCRTQPPKTILAILSNGKPSVSELNVIERLIDNYELPQEVINFLVVYVLGNLEEFPSYNYFDKIAVEWQRHNVNTIETAIKTIKKRTERLNKPRLGKQKNTIPNDVESDWFDEYWKNR